MAAVNLPLFRLLQQQCTHQANDRGGGGEYADDSAAALDLLDQSLQGVSAPDLAPVLLPPLPAID